MAFPVVAIATQAQDVDSGATVSLSGSATDTDGSVVSYLWSASPNQGSFDDRATASTTWTAPSLAGNTTRTITLTLTATDNDGDTGRASVTMRVVPASTNNYKAVEQLNGYAIDFLSNTTHTDLYEYSPAEGTLYHRTPSGMFSDTSVFWLERLRSAAEGIEDTDIDGEPFTKVSVGLHRGDSEVELSSWLAGLADTWSFVLVNEDTEQWITWRANVTRRSGRAFARYLVTPTFIEDRSFFVNLGDVRANDQSWTTNEETASFITSLTNSRLLLGLVPSGTFRPYGPRIAGRIVSGAASLASRLRLSQPSPVRVRASMAVSAPSVEARIGLAAPVRISSRTASRLVSVASRVRHTLPHVLRIRASTGSVAPQIRSRVGQRLPGSIRVEPELLTGTPVVRSRLRFTSPDQRIRARLALQPFETINRVRIRVASTYPAYLLDAIEGDYFRPVYLATVGSLNLCSTSHNISHGGKSYTGNSLSNLSTVTSGLRVEAERLDLEVGSNDAPLRRLWSQNLNRTAVKLYLSHLTESGTLAGNPVLLWSGSVAGIHEDAKQLKQYVHCESVLSNLSQTRDFYFTPESQEARYRQDRFFEFVEGLGERNLEWAGREINLADLRHLSITL